MVIYLASLFYAQMPQNSARFFFPKYSFSFSTDISLICIKICNEQPVPDQICQILLLIWMVCSRKSGLELYALTSGIGQRVLPGWRTSSHFQGPAAEEMGVYLVTASSCHGQDISSGKLKMRSSCDGAFSKHLSCGGKIKTFSLLYQVLRGLQDIY